MQVLGHHLCAAEIQGPYRGGQTREQNDHIGPREESMAGDVGEEIQVDQRILGRCMCGDKFHDTITRQPCATAEVEMGETSGVRDRRQGRSGHLSVTDVQMGQAAEAGKENVKGRGG